MNLANMSDADLVSLSRGCTLDFGPEENHNEDNCLACQAWAVWESRDPERIIR